MNWVILVCYICICTFFIVFNHILIKSKAKLIEEKSELYKENLHINEELAKTKEKQEDYDKELLGKNRTINFYESIYDGIKEISNIVGSRQVRLNNISIFSDMRPDIIKRTYFNGRAESQTHIGYINYISKELIECRVQVSVYDEAKFNEFKRRITDYIQKCGYTVEGIGYLHLDKEISVLFEGVLK